MRCGREPESQALGQWASKTPAGLQLSAQRLAIGQQIDRITRCCIDQYEQECCYTNDGSEPAPHHPQENRNSRMYPRNGGVCGQRSVQSVAQVKK